MGTYVALMDDRYPSTDEQQSVRLDLSRRKRDLNRWLPLVKWFLAIPHYIVLIFLYLAAVVVVIVVWFAILFTGRYPRGLFDFVEGDSRWCTRVVGYPPFILVTDRYPPFSMGQPETSPPTPEPRPPSPNGRPAPSLDLVQPLAVGLDDAARQARGGRPRARDRARRTTARLTRAAAVDRRMPPAYSLELTRTFPGPRARVFEFFASAALLAEWWGPTGFSIPRIEFVPRVGGTYRIQMQPPDGDAFELTGAFREVDVPSRLAFTFD